VCQPSVTDQAVSWNTARGVHILLTNKMKRHDVKLFSGKFCIDINSIYTNKGSNWKRSYITHNVFILNELW
jgi:hypothetical protein